MAKSRNELQTVVNQISTPHALFVLGLPVEPLTKGQLYNNLVAYIRSGSMNRLEVVGKLKSALGLAGKVDAATKLMQAAAIDRQRALASGLPGIPSALLDAADGYSRAVAACPWSTRARRRRRQS